MTRLPARQCLLALLTTVVGCDKKAPGPLPSAVEPQGTQAVAVRRSFDPAQLAVFEPLPSVIERADNLLTADKVALGKMLWFDSRLSQAQDVSCNSCHDVATSGADTIPLSAGTRGQRGTRNAPTVFNAAGGFAQGYSGQAGLVEDFVLPHAGQSAVMGTNEKKLIAVVASIPGYVRAFKNAFTDEKGAVTGNTVSKAIGAYSRRLLTPARWDRFLAGDQGALTDDEKSGLGAFIDANCATCHAGKYIGAAECKKLGVAMVWPSSTDLGRYETTNAETDRGVFKVPSLRNVTKTAPYLHDGSITSLEQMTKLMERHQVGRELTDVQTRSIVAFLGSLEGVVPRDLAKRPELPLSGPNTPPPE